MTERSKEVWLNGPKAGKDVSPGERANRKIEADRYNSFVLDPVEAQERQLARQLKDLGPIGLLQVQTAAAKASAARLEAELDLAQLEKDHPYAFPSIDRRPRWFYPVMMLSLAAFVVMQAVILVKLLHPTLPPPREEASSPVAQRAPAPFHSLRRVE